MTILFVLLALACFVAGALFLFRGMRALAAQGGTATHGTPVEAEVISIEARPSTDTDGNAITVKTPIFRVFEGAGPGRTVPGAVGSTDALVNVGDTMVVMLSENGDAATPKAAETGGPTPVGLFAVGGALDVAGIVFAFLAFL